MHIRIYEGRRAHIINRFVKHYECCFVAYSNSINYDYADYNGNTDINDVGAFYNVLARTLELKSPALDLDEFEKLKDDDDVRSLLEDATKQDFISTYEIGDMNC